MTAQTRPDELIRILRPEFVTKAGGVPGAACVVHTCGATGWRATGGTIARTLVHEVAFQLTDVGNARGSYAVDLQQDQFDVNDVAAGDHSAILGGRRNEIHPNSDFCTILGAWNYIRTFGGNEPYDCHQYGNSHITYGDSYQVTNIGQAHEIYDAEYCFFAGYSHEADNVLGCFSLMEGNDIIQNVNDAPNYCGNIGLFNVITGEVWGGYQMGESNYMEGDGGGGADSIWMCWQFGYTNRIDEQGNNVFQFGRNLGSYLPVGLSGEFFNGRMMLDGDDVNEASTNTPTGLGFNQNSWFGQNTAINTWTVAWISSRFQFPIIEDSVWGFTARILGTELGCANTYDWLIEGAAKNDGGTTTILWSIVTNNYRDVATKEWQVVADDPNDRLVFQYRDTNGPDATRCNIEFLMFTTEVGYES